MCRFIKIAVLGLFFCQMAFCADADVDALKRAIASNAWQINRFKAEYHKILQKQTGDKVSSWDVEQMRRLQGKIFILLNDNDRNLSLLAKKTPPEDNDKNMAKKPSPAVGLTGADWVGMSQEDKEQYVFRAIGALEVKGVFMMKPSLFYVTAMSDLINHDPALQQTVLDNIFVLAVFQNESQTRSVLKRIWQECLDEQRHLDELEKSQPETS
jgi:hypothetical protein